MAQQKTAYFIFLLFLVNALNFFDRQILGAVGELIRKEWSLSDSKLGLLSTAFTLLYAAVGLPLGRWADSGNRTRLLAGGIFVWSLLTALSGRAGSYVQLFFIRLGVGAGEAICAPASSSLIGDLFKPSQRSRAMSIFMMGLPVGIGLSFAVIPLLAKEIGWRWSFFIAGVPGIFLSLMILALKDPPRGQSETTQTAQIRRPGNPYMLVLATPTMLWLIVSGILHNFSMYALGSFLAPDLMRFHQVPITEAGLWSAAIYGFSGIPGLLIGGYAADLAIKRDARWRLWMGGIALLLSAPLMFFAFKVPARETVQFALLLGTGCGLMYIYYATVYPTIHDVIEPGLRGTAMAVYFMAMYVCGASFGPLVMGALSDRFTEQAALAANVDISLETALEPFKAAGLHQAMQILPVIGLLLGIVLLLASRNLVRDRDRMQEQLKNA